MRRNPSDIHHGGAVDAAARRYGLPRRRWLDLSTGINPRAYPLPPIPPEHWHRLPDQDLLSAALNSARLYYGVPEDAHIVAAPGSQALIQWLPHVMATSHVAIFGPTYGEHHDSWTRAGHTVSQVDQAPKEDNVVVLVNPDNPSGKKTTPSEISALRRPERLLVVDEAFADVAPGFSCVDQTGEDGVLVLRSFGKFFGLAGARLGFAIGAQKLIERLAQALGPWSVSGAVLHLAVTAFADQDWIEATRRRLGQDRRRLDGLLGAAGFPPSGGTNLFAAVSHRHAAEMFDHLARQGILVRHFPEAPKLLRVGLPGDEEAWQRLKTALDQFRTG